MNSNYGKPESVILFKRWCYMYLKKEEKKSLKKTTHDLSGKFTKKWLPSYYYSGGTSQPIL